MKLFKKVFTGFAAFAMAFALSATASAAVQMPHVFPDEESNDYGDETALIIKLQDEGIDSATASTITTVDVSYSVETDFFQPQFIANSDGVWNQFPDEQRLDGVFSYDITGQFKPENTYNEIWIKTGYKNAGAASIVSVAFKDADGNVVFQVGGDETKATASESAELTEEVVEEVVEEVTEATMDVVETTEEETVSQEVVAEETLPQTGTVPVSFYLVMGGVLITFGILVKKHKVVVNE